MCSRTIKIIELLAKEQEGMSITEISRELEIPKSTAHALLHTMLFHNILEYENERLKTFKLGIKLFEIGSSVIRRNDLQKEARFVLEKLKDRCDGTIFLVKENMGEVVYLDKLESDSSVITTAQLGSRKEMYCTGVGKAILSTYSENQLLEWSQGREFKKKTEKTITSLEELIKDLEEARKKGYAIDRGEDDPHLYCVAAPIFGADGKAQAAISIASLAFKMDQKKIKKNKKLITEAANEITKRIGGFR